MEGTVVSEVMIEPKVISFGQVGRSEKSTREFTIKFAKPEEVKLKDVTIDNPVFKLTKVSSEGNTHQYSVSFDGSEKLERLTGRITVTVEGGSTPTTSIPVNATVQGDLRYAKTLSFMKRDNAFQPRDLTISSRSQAKLKVLKVENPDKDLDYEIVENDATIVKVRFSLKNPNMTVERMKRGKVVITTNSPEEPTIEVTYMLTDRIAPRFTPPNQEGTSPAGPVPAIPPKLPGIP